VTRTWDGGGVDGTCGGAGTANNWTCAANWSADTAPTASDIATFDATSTKDATINANISVAGINIASGYTGTITQSSTYTVTVGSSHYVQADGTFTGGSGAITVNGTYTLSGGTFTSTSGTLYIYRNAVTPNETVFTVSGGTFNHNNGTVSFYLGSNLAGDTTFTANVATSLTLNDVIVDVFGYGFGFGSRILTTASGDTIIAANNFTHTRGPLNDTWEVQGNVTIGSGADGGNGTLTMTGTGDQTYTDQGGNEPDGDVTINKTAGTVTLASNADWNAANQDVTITAGMLLAMGTANISTTSLTVGASGVLRMAGTGDLTLGGDVSNAGEIFARSTTCGQTDYVLIRSSVNGTQRSWSGTGVFKMYDVDVKDQAGSAAITAYSSTNSTNNGANWTFSGAACPALPRAVQINSGIFNIGSGIVNFR
jgi:hypothetical protein